MASSRFLIAFFLSIFSQIFLGFSRDPYAFLRATDPTTVHPAPGQIPPCMQKILPCQPYIKSPVNPSPMCCLPLKEMLVDDQACLCSFFNNAELLKALNVTQSEALKLPTACGANIDESDISKCNRAKAIAPASTPASAPTPIGSTDAPLPPAKSSNDSSPTKASSASRNNPTYGIGYGLAAASSFVALLLSTF